MICLILYCSREFIISIFTTDPQIKALLLETLYKLTFYIFLENGRIFVCGIFRGISYVIIPAIIQLSMQYLVLTGISYVLAINLGYGVNGIWTSFLITYTFLYGIFIYLYFKVDFEKYKQITIKRLKDDQDRIQHYIEMDLSKTKNSFKNQEMYELLKI